jgi:hypothetical protein
MWRAIDRAFMAEDDADEEAFYAAVSEVVWWITMIDETLWGWKSDGVRYEEARGKSDDGLLVLGLRYARNRQTHDVAVTAMQGNPLLPLRSTGPWRWRGLRDEGVPPYTPREGAWGRESERVYRDRVAGAKVTEVLSGAARFLTESIEERSTSLTGRFR